jgi:hypothetical protein
MFALHKDVDMIFGNTFLIGKDDNVLRGTRNVPFWWSAMIVGGVTLPQPATFWRRRLFEKYGYLDESKLFCMDYEFFCRIGQHIKAKHIPRELACFRLHREQKTETINDVCVAEGKAIKKRYAKAACGIWPEFLFKLAILIHKTFWHLIRGEFHYVVRGFFRRSKINMGKDVSILKENLGPDSDADNT